MFAYDQPIRWQQPRRTARQRPRGQSTSLGLLELAGLLYRQKVLIVAVALAVACGVVVVGKSLTPRYTATAELYVDPFNRGNLLSKGDCVQYLLQGNYTVRDDYLAPISSRRMLLRICGNLHQIYVHLGQGEAASRLQHYLVALAR